VEKQKEIRKSSKERGELYARIRDLVLDFNEQLGNVVKSFLCNAIDHRLEGVFNRRFFDIEFLFNRNMGIGLFELPTEPRQGGEDPQVIEDGRPKVHLNPSGFPDALLNDRDERFQRFG
jgi:hypothetical protein